MKPKTRKSLCIVLDTAQEVAAALNMSVSAVIEASLWHVLKGADYETAIKKATRRSKYSQSDFMRVKASEKAQRVFAK